MTKNNLDDLTLVAAGKGTSISLPPIVDAVLDLVPDRDDDNDSDEIRLVYLGTASYDNDKAFETQTRAYRRIPRVKIERLNVSDRTSSGDGSTTKPQKLPSQEEMRSLLANAHILLCSGGDTLYALQRWKEVGIDAMIRRVAFDKNGPVLCGGSAGAVCWFQACHSDAEKYVVDDNDDWEYTKQSGLGFIPALCVPHNDVVLSNGLPRAKDSEKLLSPEQPMLGIDEAAALVIADGEARAISGDGLAKVHVKNVVLVEQDDEDDDEQHAVRKRIIRKRPFTEVDGPVPVEKLLQGDF